MSAEKQYIVFYSSLNGDDIFMNDEFKSEAEATEFINGIEEKGYLVIGENIKIGVWT